MVVVSFVLAKVGKNVGKEKERIKNIVNISLIVPFSIAKAGLWLRAGGPGWGGSGYKKGPAGVSGTAVRPTTVYNYNLKLYNFNL